MLNQDIADVPKHKGHRPPGLCDGLLGVVPSIAGTVDAARAVAVDVNPLAADHEPGMVVLEGNGIRIVSPIREIIGELDTCMRIFATVSLLRASVLP